MVLRYLVDNLDVRTAAAFEQAVRGVAGVQDVDTWRGRAEVRVTLGTDDSRIVAAAAKAGFSVRPDLSPTTTVVRIAGMTCRSCELTVERKFKAIAGVNGVDVDAAAGTATITGVGSPDVEALASAIATDGYRIEGASTAPTVAAKRTGPFEAIALFAAAIAAGAIVTQLGVGDGVMNAGGATNLAGAVVLGLVAGSSSCMAVSGGLLLSATAAYRKSLGGRASTMKPVLLFTAGRIVTYALLGAIIGLIGSALTPSPLVIAAITLIAAVYMIVAGLDMLALTPRWLARITPRMPKAISRRILDAEGRQHPAMPIILGGATFLLPCGFTQALQLYALSTGSPWFGAVVLGGFAVGTAPALLALGWASGSLKGRAGELFFKFSGAIVTVLGLWSVQNAFTVAGYPLRLPNLGPGEIIAANAVDPNVQQLPDAQVVDVTLVGEAPFYQPANRFVVTVGKPVRLVMHGFGTGCRSIFQIPKAGVREALDESTNVVEFTPDKPGEYAFSCSMGMYPGTIIAVPG